MERNPSRSASRLNTEFKPGIRLCQILTRKCKQPAKLFLAGCYRIEDLFWPENSLGQVYLGTPVRQTELAAYTDGEKILMTKPTLSTESAKTTKSKPTQKSVVTAIAD